MRLNQKELDVLNAVLDGAVGGDLSVTLVATHRKAARTLEEKGLLHRVIAISPDGEREAKRWHLSKGKWIRK
jgi:hypothetical protein